MFARRRLQPWMLISLAWLGPAFLAAVNSLAQQRIWGDKLDLRAALFSSGDWLIYALLTPAVFACAHRWQLARPKLTSRLLTHAALSLVFCALWAGGGTVLKELIQPSAIKDLRTFAASWFFTTLPFGCAVYFSMVGIEHATRYFSQARERELQVLRLSQQLTGARLATLQSQLNPHFLFNSLNTVTVLIRDGATAAATHVVEHLSNVLRLSLSPSRGAEVTVHDELDLVRQYLAVEEARFSDRLRSTLTVDPETLLAAVPSFALQHLVENAVRHGVAQRTAAGALTISATRRGEVLELVVTDDGPGIADEREQLVDHGLANTRERLRTLYGDHASLDVRRAPLAGTVARLRLPFRLLPDGRVPDA